MNPLDHMTGHNTAMLESRLGALEGRLMSLEAANRHAPTEQMMAQQRDRSVSSRIAELEAANRELALQLDGLRRELESTRRNGYRSMRDSRRCPACGSGSLLHVRRSQEAGKNAPVNSGLTHEFSMWHGTKAHGAMESFACRGCGLVEYRVIDFAGVEADGEDVIAIEPEHEPPKSGPFR